MAESTPGKTDLIAWWALDETIGTRADSHGSNDLSDNNSVGYATGKQGNAADFEKSSDQYLSIADNADLSFGDEDFTICAWVKLESHTQSGAIVAKYRFTGANQRAYLLRVDGGGTNKFQWALSGDGSASDSIYADNLGTVSDGIWYFVVAWHDSVNDEMGIQVNSGISDTKAYSSGCYDNTESFFIGIDNNVDTSRDLDGLVDEICIYGRILSQDEIDWLYNGGLGRAYSELFPLPDPIALATVINAPSISLVDLRIKLRAAKRDVLLTAQDREKIL